jgi:hypothetical protein
MEMTMGLQLKPDTGEILYDGDVVGEHSLKDGKHQVTINISYETDEDWAIPLIHFGVGLKKLKPKKRNQADLEIPSEEIDVDEVDGANIYLIEKTIKTGGYVWIFHKTDADNWPSSLHAHDYDRGLKLDAITGKIYDESTKQHCKTVKAKQLTNIHEQLCGSSDFKAKAKKYIPTCKS